MERTNLAPVLLGVLAPWPWAFALGLPRILNDSFPHLRLVLSVGSIKEMIQDGLRTTLSNRAP